MHALIAGLGLIGGSIGMALREEGWSVSYLDPYVDADTASRAGAADRRVERFIPADVVILATPADVALSMRSAIEGAGVVTTVCSVMGPFSGPEIVAGHPLAGSQERGLPTARLDLFRGRPWFVDRDEPGVAKVIAACGATAEVVDPAEHDRAMALTSHLPQLLSTALASIVDPALLRYAGPGLRTFLRLAGSDSSVWRPVIDANRESIAAHAAGLERVLAEILAGDDGPFLQARQLYERLEQAARHQAQSDPGGKPL
ncbi:MAG: prephenate dehydrogenase/arogenate dehydrogenase family protein [Acidobacteriota bacterium]